MNTRRGLWAWGSENWGARGRSCAVSCKIRLFLANRGFCSALGPLSRDAQNSLFSYSEFDCISGAPSRLTSSAFAAPTQQLLDDVYIYDDVLSLLVCCRLRHWTKHRTKLRDIKYNRGCILFPKDQGQIIRNYTKLLRLATAKSYNWFIKLGSRHAQSKCNGAKSKVSLSYR